MHRTQLILSKQRILTVQPKPAQWPISGFTLVEIVVVIAIAALILTALLIFVPQAQNAQQDGERRRAASEIVAKAQEFAGNNLGAFPAQADINPGGSFTSTYISQIQIDTTHTGSGCTWRGSSTPPGSLAPGVCKINTTGSQIDVFIGLTNSAVLDEKNY